MSDSPVVVEVIEGTGGAHDYVQVWRVRRQDQDCRAERDPLLKASLGEGQPSETVREVLHATGGVGSLPVEVLGEK
jgi:hypothetical protein